MTVENSDSIVTYTGNGATTSFDFSFKIPDDDSLVVSLYDIDTGVLTALDPGDYSATGIGSDDGGSVTYPLSGSPIASDTKIVIQRLVAYKQQLDITSQQAYDPSVLEDQLDLIVMQIQQLAEESDRAIHTTAGSGTDPDTLFDTLIEASAAAEAALAAIQDLVGESELYTVTTFAWTLLDDADAAAMRSTLGLGTAAVKDTGTSGANVPLLNGANTWSAQQTLSALLNLVSGQIAFPATQAASADPNTLDDYEEGSFTPILQFNLASTGITYSVQGGSYTKIGNRVYFSLEITLSNKGSSTGAATLGGLPFTAAENGVCAIRITSTAAAIDGQITALINTGSTVMGLQYRDNGSSTISNLTNTNFANTTDVIISGHYKV